MAAGFSVKDALNKNSKAGIDESPRARFRTKDISIFKMYRNDMNFYSVEQVEELAGDILMYGLKQNLELVYAPCEKGEYRIVAGERRWEALKHLVSKGYKEFELATSDMLIRFAIRGFGIAGVAEDFALEAMEKGEIFRLHFDREIPKRHFCIVTDEKVPMTAAARRFLDLLEDKCTSDKNKT